MSLPFNPKSLICGLLGGLLLTLPLAQSEVTLQTLEPITLDQTEITKSTPDCSNQTGTFHREHYTLLTTYGDYSKIEIEERFIALKGTLKDGNQAFLYTLQNNSNEALSLTIHNSLSPEQAMKAARGGRLFWAFSPVFEPILMPAASVISAGKMLYLPIGMGMSGVGKSTGKWDRIGASIFFSVLFGPFVIPVAAMILIVGVVGTVVLIPVSLVKTPINLAKAKRNDRLAKQQIQSTNFKSDKATIILPPQATIQFAVLLQPKAESSKLPLFTIKPSL